MSVPVLVLPDTSRFCAVLARAPLPFLSFSPGDLKRVAPPPSVILLMKNGASFPSPPFSDPKRVRTSFRGSSPSRAFLLSEEKSSSFLPPFVVSFRDFFQRLGERDFFLRRFFFVLYGESVCLARPPCPFIAKSRLQAPPRRRTDFLASFSGCSSLATIVLSETPS